MSRSPGPNYYALSQGTLPPPMGSVPDATGAGNKAINGFSSAVKTATSGQTGEGGLFENPGATGAIASAIQGYYSPYLNQLNRAFTSPSPPTGGLFQAAPSAALASMNSYLGGSQLPASMQHALRSENTAANSSLANLAPALQQQVSALVPGSAAQEVVNAYQSYLKYYLGGQLTGGTAASLIPGLQQDPFAVALVQTMNNLYQGQGAVAVPTYVQPQT